MGKNLVIILICSICTINIAKAAQETCTDPVCSEDGGEAAATVKLDPMEKVKKRPRVVPSKKADESDALEAARKATEDATSVALKVIDDVTQEDTMPSQRAGDPHTPDTVGLAENAAVIAGGITQTLVALEEDEERTKSKATKNAASMTKNIIKEAKTQAGTRVANLETDKDAQTTHKKKALEDEDDDTKKGGKIKWYHKVGNWFKEHKTEIIAFFTILATIIVSLL